LLLILAALVLCPMIIVLQAGILAESTRWDEVIYRPFLAASLRSGILLCWLLALGGTVGWILGAIAVLWKFPLNPFVVAIGIQSLQPYFAFSTITWLDGQWGSVWSGLAIVLPVTVYGTMLAGRQITTAEREVLRLTKGTKGLLWQVLLRVMPVSYACALLGSMLVIADPGAGQIMGYHGISGDILVAFSARNDFQLAAMKALALMVMFGPLMLIVCCVFYRRIDYTRLMLITRGRQLLEPKWLVSVLLGSLYAFICSVPLIAAMIGLVRPLMKPPIEKYLLLAREMFLESLGTTILYGISSGLVAVVIAVCFMLVSRNRKKMQWCLLAGGLVLLAVPSCIPSLGMVSLGSQVPAGMDFLFRSQWVVGVTLGLRFVPAAFLLLMIANTKFPISLGEVAAVHQIPLWKRVLRIHLPIRLPALLMTVLIVMILTLSDVSSIALLQPPGGASFGSHLFAVMDNASEKMVASLCVVYLSLPLTLVMLIGVITFWKNLMEPPQ